MQLDNSVDVIPLDIQNDNNHIAEKNPNTCVCIHQTIPFRDNRIPRKPTTNSCDSTSIPTYEHPLRQLDNTPASPNQDLSKTAHQPSINHKIVLKPPNNSNKPAPTHSNQYTKRNAETPNSLSSHTQKKQAATKKQHTETPPT
jgi:hypothetical protein